MGGNIQKVKQNGGNQLIDINEKDLKQNANLGTSRWFYNTQFTKWEFYNFLSEEEKQKTFWTIFPLEISNEIERAYINKFPFEKLDKMIFFDFLEQKHVLLCNKDNSLAHLGIVKRDEPNNKTIIKKENHFNTKNNYLFRLDNTVNPYQYHLLNNLAILCYENIFSFFNIELSENKLIKKFLSTTIICTQKLYNFVGGEYQEYLKNNFLKLKDTPFSLITIKSILLFDFKNEQIYLNYFLNDMEEKDFDVIIMNMFLEASAFSQKILEFSSNCSRKNVEYTTFYLCLLFILMTQRDKENNISLWENENENKEEKEQNKIINEIKDDKVEQKEKENNKIIEKGEIRTYIYFPIQQIKKFYENDYFFCNNFLITSKNKFNNIFDYDNESKKNFVEIEMRIPKKNYATNLHPMFHLDELDIEKYSLYNEQNIIFSSNSVFKCKYIDRVNNKVILEFIRDAIWNPILYIKKENKKMFGIIEDGFKFLTEEQRKQVYIARVKNKEVKFINGLSNLRELEIYDDAEPKTNIFTLTPHFNQFKKLNCLTIIGNNMGNKDCLALSNGLKFLKELKILNLSFNCLTDSNISKISFNSNNKIEVLNLKSNNATELSIEIFKDELIKLKNLKELNMLDNQFGDQGLSHLLQVFIIVNDLRVLIISNCNITNKGINSFAEFLKKENKCLNNLEILNLISNPFNDDSLFDIIYIIQNLPNLKKFSIAQSQISQSGLNLIFDKLNNSQNKKKWAFDQNGGWFTLIEKDIKEEKKFLDAIRQNETPVIFNTLRISWLRKNRKKLANKIHFDFSNCNIRGKNIIFEFEKELMHFPNLRIINLSYNDNISLPGYEALSQGLKRLSNLSQLLLSSNNLSDKAFEYICIIFENCQQFSKLDVSNNLISNFGFINFILNLSKFQIKILEMDFYNNKIGDDGFRIFCEEAKNETFINLQKFNIGKNELGNESMKCFSEIFLKCINLVEINFSYNNFTDEIAIYFSPKLNDLIDNIQIIDITNNKLSEGLKTLFKESGIPLNIIY